MTDCIGLLPLRKPSGHDARSISCAIVSTRRPAIVSIGQTVDFAFQGVHAECEGGIFSPALALDCTNPLDYPDSGLGTIAETPEFSRCAARLLSPVEHEALILTLAMNPLAGDLIRGTGGVRKLRWARRGRGKSGGVRVIYYFHSDNAPLYLLTMYGKSERADLTEHERNELAGLTAILKRRIENRR